MSKKKKNIKTDTVLKNKRAKFDYEILEEEVAGIKLLGTEVKSIRSGKASLSESYIYVNEDNSVWIKGMHISEYDKQGYSIHDPDRDKQLLLTKKQAEKWRKETQSGGLTIVPIVGKFNDKGKFKITIALAKGKKLYDKRNSLKEKDIKRSLQYE